jgi:AcrR family transcriptional regulator
MSRGRSRARTFVALRDLLLEHPWAEVTLEAVAKRAGVSRQTLYNDFGSRNGLAQAYTEAMADAYCDLVDEAMGADDDLRVGIEAAIRLILEGTGADPLIQRVQTGQAHHDLVRIVTADSGPLLERIAGRLAGSLLKHWPELDAVRAEAAGVLMARVGLGFAVMPPPRGVDLAPAIAAVLTTGLGTPGPDTAAPRGSGRPTEGTDA